MNLEYSEAIESFLIEIQEYDKFFDFEIDDDRYVLKICIEILCDYCYVKKAVIEYLAILCMQIFLLKK